MKKLTLIPLALIVLVGALWASSIITPDKPGFPSNPQTPGTLGYILLSLFGTDGTAKDSLALGGVSATGYLQVSNTTCTNPGEVWKGINTDGTVECGTRGTLLAIGRFSEISGAVEVSTNGTNWTTANTTDTLSEGTIVRTTSGTGTIAFVADDSILRLDTNTTLQLQSGDLGGNTVAQAILSDGRLWGRIMTSTGVNIGGGGLIAGVRGTSISMKKAGTSIEIAVIDSTNPTEAAKIYSSNTPIATLTPGTDYKDTDTTDSTPGTRSINTQLLTDTWIQKNTLADIAYITDTLSGTTDISKKDRLSQEIIAVLPPGASIPDGLVDTDSKSEIDADSNEDEDGSTPEQKSKNNAERIKCKKEDLNTRWWKSTRKCEDKNWIAYTNWSTITDSTRTSLPLLTRQGIVSASGGSVANITNTGQYLSYKADDTIGFRYANLAGKTITITLASAVGTTPIAGQTKFYIADFGNEKWFVTKDERCISSDSLGTYLCKVNSGGIPSNMGDGNKTSFSLTMTIAPSQMILGNTNLLINELPHQLPIGTTIKSIRIQ